MTSTTSVGFRREHENRVLAALRDRGPQSRAELSQVVGLSRSSLSEVTSGLLDRGAIVVLENDAAERTGAGRPAERLALDPRSGQFIGLDFQHVLVDVAIADATHRVLATGRERYDESTPWHQRLQVAYDLIERVAAEAGVHFNALSWIFAGVPGPFVPPSATFVLPEYAQQTRVVGYGVREALSGRFGVPVTVDNNTRLAALAEATAPGGASELIYVRLGGGVGGGVIQEGRISRGAHYLSGDLGHVEVDGYDAPCRCGRRGCLETIASMPAVLAALGSMGALAEDGSIKTDPESTEKVAEVTDQVAKAIGVVLRPIVMAIDPALVVIAGPVLQTLPDLLARCESEVLKQKFWGLHLHRVSGPNVNAFEGALGALEAGFNTAPATGVNPSKGFFR